MLFMIVLALSIFGVHISLVRAHDQWNDLLNFPFSILQIVTLLALVIGLYVADAWRFSQTLKLLGRRLPFGVCIEASVVNFFFAWITPGGALGAPSAIVLLQRHGIPFEQALLVAYNKSLVGIYMLLASALLALFFLPLRGLSFQFTHSWFFNLIICSLVVYLCIILAPFFLLKVSENHPWMKRWPMLEKLKDQIQALHKIRLQQWLGIFLAHLFYFSIFIGIATLICSYLGAPSLIDAGLLSTIKLAVAYIAPTPGGSGIAEMTAIDFYSGILAPNQAILAVLCFRSFTFYLQMLIGGIYFVLTFSKNFLGNIVRMSKQGYR